MSGNGCLEKVVFKLLDIPDNEEEEESEMSQMEENMDGDTEKGAEDENMSENSVDELSGMDGDGNGPEKKKKRKRNEREVTCGVLITCGHKDVDQDVFKSIHDNGLVYNGRLIVDKSFKTTDPSIFAAGSLCEFSNRYMALA